MRNFQQKRTWRDILESKPVLILLGILLLFFLWSMIGLWGKVLETSKSKKIAEDKVTELTQQKEKLTTEINDLKTPEGIDATIRDKYGLAKVGEGEIVVVDDTSTQSQAAASVGFWARIQSWFK